MQDCRHPHPLTGQIGQPLYMRVQDLGNRYLPCIPRFVHQPHPNNSRAVTNPNLLAYFNSSRSCARFPFLFSATSIISGPHRQQLVSQLRPPLCYRHHCPGLHSLVIIAFDFLRHQCAARARPCCLPVPSNIMGWHHPALGLTDFPPRNYHPPRCHTQC